MRAAVLIVALALGAAACGGSEQSRELPRGAFFMEQVQTSGHFYPGGSRSYFRAVPVPDVGLADGLDVELSRTPQPTLYWWPYAGEYTLRSWQRACELTCDQLEPPSDQCSGRMKIRKGHETHVTVRLRPGSGCQIVVD
jgi:hypothetical protein